MAREVGAIAAKFPQDNEIQIEHAEALKHAAYAQSRRGLARARRRRSVWRAK